MHEPLLVFKRKRIHQSPSVENLGNGDGLLLDERRMLLVSRCLAYGARFWHHNFLAHRDDSAFAQVSGGGVLRRLHQDYVGHIINAMILKLLFDQPLQFLCGLGTVLSQPATADFAANLLVPICQLP